MSTVGTAQSSDAAVYETLRGDLVRYAAAFVGRDSAEDVLSTVMIRIMSRQKLTDFDQPRPYLYKAVLNEARSMLRGRDGRGARSHGRGAFATVLGNSPGSLALDGDVRRAVLALPPRQRAATYLTYWNGCSIAETADLMGRSPGTVGRYLHLARKHLRRALDGRRSSRRPQSIESLDCVPRQPG